MTLRHLTVTWKGCEHCDIEFGADLSMWEHLESELHRIMRGEQSEDAAPGMLISELLDQSTLDYIAKRDSQRSHARAFSGTASDASDGGHG